MAYLVVDNAFNRANYPDMIGMKVNNPPSYVNVKEVDEEFVWTRVGDPGEYEKADTPYQAGIEVGKMVALRPCKQVAFRYIRTGVEIAPYFVQDDYIGLYWGDKDSHWNKDLSSYERREFERGVEEQVVELIGPVEFLMPNAPKNGPPLPRGLNISWPWRF